MDTKTIQRISNLLDEVLVKRLEQAKSGEGPPLTAAEIKAINDRLKSPGVASFKMPTAEDDDPGETMSDIIARVAAGKPMPNDGHIPPVDTDCDDAATA